MQNAVAISATKTVRRVIGFGLSVQNRNNSDSVGECPVWRENARNRNSWRPEILGETAITFAIETVRTSHTIKSHIYQDLDAQRIKSVRKSVDTNPFENRPTHGGTPLSIMWIEYADLVMVQSCIVTLLKLKLFAC